MRATHRLVTTTFIALVTLLPGAAVAQAPEASPRLELDRRLAGLSPDDAAGLFELACWCRAQDLHGSARRLARRVLERHPDHAGAHRLLGHVKTGAQWRPREDVMEELGLVRYRGRWHTVDDVARLRAEAGAVLRRRRLQAAIDRQVQLMASESAATRARALKALLALGEKEGLPGLAPAARKLHQELERYWAAVATARIEVRAQDASLTRLRRFTTSLGSGSPVTLELPELRRTSISTSVLVPAGR